MTSYLFELSPLEQAGASLVSEVGHQLQSAVVEERAQKKLTKQAIATTLGVNRSHVHRMLSGHYNLTLVSLGELAHAIGREVHISLHKIENDRGCNFHHLDFSWSIDGGDSNNADIQKHKKQASERVIEYEY